MANNCYIGIQIIGEEADVAKAETDLKGIFSFAWDEQTKRQKPDGSLLAVRYPWCPPADELEEVFEAHSSLIFLTAFWEDGLGFRGLWAWAYGYEVGFAGGPYGPDGDEFYDEIAPLPDILTPWRDPLTRKTPAQVAEEFKDKAREIESERQGRRARLAAKEQKRQLALAEAAEEKRQKEASEAEREAERIKRNADFRAAEEAELAPSYNGITPPEDIERVISYLDFYPRLAYSEVAQKFNWKLDFMLQELEKVGQFDEARLQPRPDQPADMSPPPGRYSRAQAEEFFRARGESLAEAQERQK